MPRVRTGLFLVLRERLEHDGTVRLTDERCRAAGRRGGVHEVDLLQKAWRTQHRGRPLNIPNHHPIDGSPLIPTDTLKRPGIGFLGAAIAGLECTQHVPGLAQRACNGFFLILGNFRQAACQKTEIRELRLLATSLKADRREEDRQGQMRSSQPRLLDGGAF